MTRPDDRRPKEAGDAPRWLDRPENVTKIIRALVAACVLLVLADLVYHKHVHYGFERWLGFYGFYGFVSCVLLVRAAVVMRRLLMRPEDYYEPMDPEAEAPLAAGSDAGDSETGAGTSDQESGDG